MATATLTDKGQIIIPQEIRVYLGLQSGDKLEFLIDNSGNVILTPLTSDVTKLKGSLPKPQKAVTIEEMNQAIAKHIADAK